MICTPKSETIFSRPNGLANIAPLLVCITLQICPPSVLHDLDEVQTHHVAGGMALLRDVEHTEGGDSLSNGLEYISHLLFLHCALPLLRLHNH